VQKLGYVELDMNRRSMQQFRPVQLEEHIVVQLIKHRGSGKIERTYTISGFWGLRGRVDVKGVVKGNFNPHQSQFCVVVGITYSGFDLKGCLFIF
jgi:hypothetical protein